MAEPNTDADVWRVGQTLHELHCRTTGPCERADVHRADAVVVLSALAAAGRLLPTGGRTRNPKEER